MALEDRGVVLDPARASISGYVVKYIGFVIYGLHASIKGVTTISDTTSADWAFVWPLVVSALALFALLGLIRTKQTGRVKTEIIATVCLLAHLTTYSIYIVIRAHAEGDGFMDAAAAWLPILLCVFPFRRISGLWGSINLPAWVYRLARRK